MRILLLVLDPLSVVVILLVKVQHKDKVQQRIRVQLLVISLHSVVVIPLVEAQQQDKAFHLKILLYDVILPLVMATVFQEPMIAV